jgi:hypothetical protein
MQYPLFLSDFNEIPHKSLMSVAVFFSATRNMFIRCSVLVEHDPEKLSVYENITSHYFKVT